MVVQVAAADAGDSFERLADPRPHIPPPAARYSWLVLAARMSRDQVALRQQVPSKGVDVCGAWLGPS